MGRRYLTAAEGAKDDLEAALKLAPDNIAVLLTAANMAKNRCTAEVSNVRDGSPAERAKAQDKANSLNSQAIDYYEHAIKVAPDDQRAYHDLGQMLRNARRHESRDDDLGARHRRMARTMGGASSLTSCSWMLFFNKEDCRTPKTG